MKKITFHRFSITGLLLATISSITMITSAKRDAKVENNGMLIISDDGLDPTCVENLFSDECTFTMTLGSACVFGGTGSRTSTYFNDTSSITATLCINKVRTQSTVFDVWIDIETENRVHTSADEDNL